eukprot:6207232-Pleurochrysis_carterae.AAC.1
MRRKSERQGGGARSVAVVRDERCRAVGSTARMSKVDAHPEKITDESGRKGAGATIDDKRKASTRRSHA